MFRIGLGYNYRFSIDPELNISKTSSTSGTNNYRGYGNYYLASQSSGNDYKTERYKTNFSSHMFYIPVGIELCLGKRENFLGRLSLLAEAEGGIVTINSSMTGKDSTTVFSGRLGLKIGL
jgi:hypothetical protein